jgi:outer membrane receptor protein involved in Fe transport
MTIYKCLALALLLPAAIFAQASTGTLSGLIVDPSGATVGNAEITITEDRTAIERRLTATSSGAFTFAFLRPGRYTLVARHDAFAPAQLNDILINVGDDVNLKITLTVGSRTDTITVVAEAPLTTKGPGLATVVDRGFVENLPMNGRSFQSVIQLTPGVVPTPANTTQQGQFSVNGSRESANNFTVDGVAANLGISASGANFNGASGQFGGFNAVGATTSLVSLEAMQEFTVQTSGFAPEYGRTPGGQISIVTRSGANVFTGTVFEYFRHDRLNANDFFANSRGIARQKLRNNEFGGVLGGPVRRNTTFFFVSYEALRQRLPVVAIVDVPSVASRRVATGAVAEILNAFPVPTGPDVASTGLAQFAGGYSTPASSDAAGIRIDHTVAGRFTFFGRYNYAPSEASTRGVSSNSLSVLVPTNLRTQTLTLGATLVFTPHLLDDLRINISRNTGHQVRIPDTYGGASVPNPALLFPDFAPPASSVLSFYTRGAGTPPALLLGDQGTNSQRQWNLVDTLSFHQGSHQLKFGVDHRRLTPLFDFVDYQQTVNFASIAATVNGSVLNAIIQSFKGPFHPRFTNLSLFAQDTWLLTPRLTLTYGVRYELNPAPSERDGNDPRSITGVESPATIALAPQGAKPYRTRYNNFAPRAGVAYIVSQRPGRETVLRGGAGVFYDIASTQTGAAYRAFSYPYAASRSLTSVGYPFTAADASIPEFTTAPPYSLMYGSDPNLKLPYTVQFNLGVEQSLGAFSTLSATYTGSAGRRLYRTEFYQNQVVNFSQLRVVRNLDSSDYNSLQAQYRRRLSKDLQVLAHYTLSKSLDTSSSEAQMYLPVVYSPAAANRGASDFDRRHSFAMAASYGLPKSLRTGIWLDGTYRALSASPVDVTATSSALGVVLRPDIVPGQPLVLDDANAPGGFRFNRAAFLTRADNNGTLGRNVLRGFPLYQLDLAMRREFRFERLRLQARAEVFNLFNRANLANPSGVLTASTFGTSTQMLNQNLAGLNALYQIGGPRSLQFAVKLYF